MQFQKKINNSVAWALNDEGESIIVLGKGIAFGKTEGQKNLIWFYLHNFVKACKK